MTINIKSKKIIGAFLLVFFLFQTISMILSVIGVERTNSFVWYLRLVTLLILAISFFVEKEKLHNIIMFSSFCVACLYEIICMSMLHRNIPFSTVLYFIAYAFIGFCVLTNRKQKRNIVYIVAIFVFAIITLCYGCIIGNLVDLLIRTTNDTNYITVSSFASYSVYSFIELVCVLFDMLDSNSKNKDNVKQGIVLNTEIINFKDLLQFVENEYNSGRITEEEYQVKRKEIISKL